jgi:branched-chain amino acid transport system substrate-binding protein
MISPSARSILAASVAGIAALGFTLAASAQAPIKIGAPLALTGPASLLGDPQKKTFELVMPKINAEGGVLGRKVEVVMYDTGSEAKNMVTFTKRLIDEDKVDIIIGGTSTGETMAVAPIIDQAGIAMISQGGASVVIDPVKKWLFKTPHTDTMAVSKVYEDMKKNNLTKVGLIAGDGGFDKSCIANAEALAKKYGMQIVGNETVGRGDTDFTPQLTKLKNAPGIQAILFCGFGQSSVIVNKNYRQLGLTNIPFYHNHGSCSKTVVNESGGGMEGVKLPCPAVVAAEKLPDSDPNKKAAMAYVGPYKEKYKEEAPIFGAHVYDALMIFVDAAKRAGSADRAKLRDAIEHTTNLAASAGTYNMSPTDHMGLKLSDFKMLQVKNGDWSVLY